jgi:excisionase family DNA binding protein
MLCICVPRLAKARQKPVNVTMDARPSPLGLSISQAANELGVSLGTMRRWADLGYIESYRTPGGQRRFSRDQVDRFVESLTRRDLQHSTLRDIAV